MKQVKKHFVRGILIAGLALVCSPLGAVEKFEQAGPIGAIGNARFTVESQEYRIAPGARLRSYDRSRKRLSDFRVGDVIVFQGKVVSGVYFVDLIIYHAPKPS